MAEDNAQIDNKPTLTPAERIADLNDIDQSISTLLAAASDAVAVLSNSPSDDNQRATLRNATSARAAFSKAAETYFNTLSSIEVRLRRQVYALEEAELIQPGTEMDTRKGRSLLAESNQARVGGGPLDPSWLNARASDSVEKSMKAELLVKAKDFLKSANESSVDEVGGEQTGEKAEH